MSIERICFELQMPVFKLILDGYRKDYSVRKVATRQTRRAYKVYREKQREKLNRFTRHEQNWDKERCSTTSLKIAKTKRKMDRFYRTVRI